MFFGLSFSSLQGFFSGIAISHMIQPSFALKILDYRGRPCVRVAADNETSRAASVSRPCKPQQAPATDGSSCWQGQYLPDPQKASISSVGQRRSEKLIWKDNDWKNHLIHFHHISPECHPTSRNGVRILAIVEFRVQMHLLVQFLTERKYKEPMKRGTYLSVFGLPPRHVIGWQFQTFTFHVEPC